MKEPTKSGRRLPMIGAHGQRPRAADGGSLYERAVLDLMQVEQVQRQRSGNRSSMGRWRYFCVIWPCYPRLRPRMTNRAKQGILVLKDKKKLVEQIFSQLDNMFNLYEQARQQTFNQLKQGRTAGGASGAGYWTRGVTGWARGCDRSASVPRRMEPGAR